MGDGVGAPHQRAKRDASRGARPFAVFVARTAFIVFAVCTQTSRGAGGGARGGALYVWTVRG